jgi:hypothetical protein
VDAFTLHSTSGGNGGKATAVRWSSIFIEGERTTFVTLSSVSNIMQQLMDAMTAVVDAEAPGWRELKPCCHLWRCGKCPLQRGHEMLAAADVTTPC